MISKVLQRVRRRTMALKPINGLIGMCLAFLVLSEDGYAAEYHVDRTADNTVRFISEATFEDFEGVTDAIDGYVFWKGDALTENGTYDESELYFEVTLDELDTGIGLRNSDMREDYLETDKYPYAKYKATIEDVRRVSDTSFVVNAAGNMTIHGTTNPLKTECTIIQNGNRYRVQTSFTVALPDYNIEVPSMLFLRLAEEIPVKLDFWVKEAKK